MNKKNQIHDDIRNIFDWTFCIGSLEHAYDIEKALSEILRVTKTGSFISVPIEGAKQFNTNPSHNFHSYTLEGWKGLFKGAQVWKVKDGGGDGLDRPRADVLYIKDK